MPAPVPSKEELIQYYKRGGNAPIDCDTLEQYRDVVFWLRDIGGFLVSDLTMERTMLSQDDFSIEHYTAPGVNYGWEVQSFSHGVVLKDSMTYAEFIALPDKAEVLTTPDDLEALLL